jgi:glycosyltransferase involved in cell wall biosynthesis
VHSSQPGTYGPAASLRRFVDATVGVSPRVRDHLVRWRGFDPSTTHCIVNGVHTSQYPPRRGRGSGPLRLLYLGRIEERQKGVFWLPEIMRRLDRHPVALTVAGEGADLPKLRRRCEDLGDRVRFIGAVPAGNVPQLLARHDALILPSRYEGLAMSLIEAMAAGCVPVASSLGGVTDFAVSHESNGFLFPVGNVKAAARCIATLADDEARCARMGEAARKTVQERFDIDVVAAAYARVIDQVRRRKPTCGPLDLDDWSYPMAFNNRLRRVVPEPVRRWVLSR